VQIDDERPDAWGVFARGDTGEDWVAGVFDRAQLAEHGGPKLGLAFSATGKHQVTVIDEINKLAATPDGIMWLGSEPILLEIKTIDPRVNLNGPRPTHVRQVMFAMALMARVHSIKPKRAVILYVNCGNYADVEAFDIDYDEVEGDALIDRAKRIHAATLDDLQPEGVFDGGNECKTCDFAAQCKAYQVERVERAEASADIDDDDLASLDDLAAQREAAAQMEGEAKRLKESATNQIRMLLDDRGLSFAQTPGYSIRQSVTKGRETCDWRQAVEDGVDLSDYVSVGNGYPRLTVRKVKDDGE
jgi:CRISPR/Cas system-associated exonuclease Cas4 (RecB family)